MPKRCIDARFEMAHHQSDRQDSVPSDFISRMNIDNIVVYLIRFASYICHFVSCRASYIQLVDCGGKITKYYTGIKLYK